MFEREFCPKCGNFKVYCDVKIGISGETLTKLFICTECKHKRRDSDSDKSYSKTHNYWKDNYH